MRSELEQIVVNRDERKAASRELVTSILSWKVWVDVEQPFGRHVHGVCAVVCSCDGSYQKTWRRLANDLARVHEVCRSEKDEWGIPGSAHWCRQIFVRHTFWDVYCCSLRVG